MTQPPDDAALVARLRSLSPHIWKLNGPKVIAEAATALEAKDRRIADLETELRLIAEAEFVDVMFDPGWAIRIARTALEPSDKGF